MSSTNPISRVLAVAVLLLCCSGICSLAEQGPANHPAGHACCHRPDQDASPQGPQLSVCPHQFLPESSSSIPAPSLSALRLQPVTALPGPPDGGATVPKPGARASEPPLHLRHLVIRI